MSKIFELQFIPDLMITVSIAYIFYYLIKLLISKFYVFYKSLTNKTKIINNQLTMESPVIPTRYENPSDFINCRNNINNMCHFDHQNIYSKLQIDSRIKIWRKILFNFLCDEIKKLLFIMTQIENDISNLRQKVKKNLHSAKFLSKFENLLNFENNTIFNIEKKERKINEFFSSIPFSSKFYFGKKEKNLIKNNFFLQKKLFFLFESTNLKTTKSTLLYLFNAFKENEEICSKDKKILLKLYFDRKLKNFIFDHVSKMANGVKIAILVPKSTNGKIEILTRGNNIFQLCGDKEKIYRWKLNHETDVLDAIAIFGHLKDDIE